MSAFAHLKSHYERVKELYLKYERVLMPGTLLFGFIVDYITFTSINTKSAFTVLLIYWLVAGFIIIFIHLYDERRVSEKLRYVRLAAPLLLQFFFGALLGGSFIFYWFSGAFSASWPFILALVILMISNDMLRAHFHRPILQIGIYFFVSFSLFSVILPFIFNSLSPWLFIGAGVLSGGIIYGYTHLLARISGTVRERKIWIWTVVISILAVMNLFYFTAVIPPIPLSIREAGIYHNIEKENSVYILYGEDENIIQKLIPGQTLHIQPESRVYAYSAIFAPGNLTTMIDHHWEYRDQERGAWVRTDTSSFPIIGGRSEGFRGYTWKSHLSPGRWRVSVETQRGQVLGRIKFTIEHVEEAVELETTRR